MPRSEQPIPMKELMEEVRLARTTLVGILKGFDTPGSDIRKLFEGVGCAESVVRDPACIMFCRRFCLEMSAGLFRRLELRLNSYPYRLWVLCAEGVPAADRASVADEFFAMPGCCLGWFGARLRRLFKTRAALLGPLAKVTLSTWLSTLIFSVYACEREHASMRRLISGVGPGRNFSLVARERVLEGTRTINIERGCSDPLASDELTGGKRRKTSQIADGSADAAIAGASPLYAPSTLAIWNGGAVAGVEGDPSDALAAAAAPAMAQRQHGSAGGLVCAGLPKMDEGIR